MSRPAILALALPVVVLAAACGGTSSSSSAAAPAPAASGSTAAGRGAGGAASGQIVSVGSSTFSVATGTTKRSVAFTAATTFSKTLTATPSAVAVGQCVSVFGTTAGSAAPASAPDTAITAAAISLRAPVNGSCAAGTGGFSGGGRLSPPAGATPPAGARGFRPVAGTVASVTASGFTVAEPARGSSPAVTVTVTVTATTTVTKQISASSADLTVGLCAAARGSVVNRVVQARTVTISDPVNGACPTRTGRFPAAGGAAPANA